MPALTSDVAVDGTASAVDQFSHDLETLGQQCAELATQLKSRLLKSGHPLPSFSPDGPEAYPTDDPSLDQLREQLRESAKTLYELASDPDDAVTRELYAKIHDMNAFAYVARYNVADSIPTTGSISYRTLAEQTGTGHGQLRKALRHLMTLRVFAEPAPEHVGHTAASKRLLARGVRLNNGFLCRETFKMAAFQVDAIDKWGHDSADADRTAHNMAHGTELPIFRYLRETSLRADDFGELMAYLFKSASRGHERLLGSYDWAALGAVTMVDVGGSTGHCSVVVARANPDMKFVVQDLPHVVASASNPATCTVPADLRGRITFQGHDMMQPQPVVADVYFMRMVLHDWSDPACEKALAQLAGAMERRPGSRLLVVDSILPPAGQWPTVVERPIRVADLQMGLVHNGKERQLDEWADLFRRGDARFFISRIVQQERSPLAIMEVMLK
ncbi:O-methyltransferase aurJ [Colletotrichum orbiculare MAFF 240422]|uniref:O-methyltransferase aurJ n=1 Tax=Colletotrichum orbiculare (strain 104-T / ATCC 96160 / CBS 514.97 / LARS 414 / MAFF 240422) TaxID=1213857 RepID=N4VT16_COLOR|nr:O-methyltransferase aurJ [Colletotrichum orbiculare MAFF 240422]